MAKKYFGDEDPLDKVLKFDNRTDYRVTAVYKEISQRLPIFILILLYHFTAIREYKQEIWLSNNFHTYVLLKKNADPVAFEKKMPQLVERYVAPRQHRH